MPLTTLNERLLRGLPVIKVAGSGLRQGKLLAATQRTVSKVT